MTIDLHQYVYYAVQDVTVLEEKSNANEHNYYATNQASEMTAPRSWTGGRRRRLGDRERVTKDDLAQLREELKDMISASA